MYKSSLCTAEAVMQHLPVVKQIILTSLPPPFVFYSGGCKITMIGRNFNVMESAIISDDQRSNLTVSLNLLYNTKYRPLNGLGFVLKV